MTFELREEKEAPTYVFDENTIEGVTPQAGESSKPFKDKVQITITKTYPVTSSTSPQITITGLPTSTTDKTIRFKQKKVKFLVEAHYDTATGAFVPNVGFRLMLDGKEFAEGNYETEPATATTKDGKVTLGQTIAVTLTEAGIQAIKTANKPLMLSWTNVPAGYMYKGDHADVTVYNNSTGALADAKVILDTITIKVAAGAGGKAPYIADTAFELSAGARFYTNKTAAGKFIEIKLTKAQADAVSQNGGFTVKGTQAPFGYTITGNPVVSGNEYTIPLKEKSRAGTVVVTKETRENSIDGDPYYVPETKEGSKKRRIPKPYYVTAFTDAALTKPATDAKGKIISKEIDVPYAWYYSNIKSNKGNRTAVLEGLYLDETYYLAETTDAKKGKVLQPNKDTNGIKAIWFKTKGASDSRSKIAVKLTSKTAKSVNMVNVYAERGLSRATYRIKVNVVDSDNKAKSSVLTASFRIWGADNTHWGADIPVKLVDTASRDQRG